MNQQINLQDSNLKEIFNTLLMGGYFRIRISSISVLDKILGGIVWCITCSNFDIDISYSDDLNMGQKIKLSEKVVDCLKQMQCPYILQPHQIQGLDLPKLLPVFKWAITFVHATREQRMNYNKNLSMHLGKQLYHNDEEYASTVQLSDMCSHNLQQQILSAKMKNNRYSKNSRIVNHNYNDPLRVYSKLIEYDDKTAYTPYHKLAALQQGKHLLNQQQQNQQNLHSPQHEHHDLNFKQVKTGQNQIQEESSHCHKESHNLKQQNSKQTSKIEDEFNVFIETQNEGVSESALQALSAASQEGFQLTEHASPQSKKDNKIGQMLFNLVSNNTQQQEDIKGYEHGMKLAQEGQKTQQSVTQLIEAEKEKHSNEMSRLNKFIEKMKQRVNEEKEGVQQVLQQKTILDGSIAELQKGKEAIAGTMVTLETKLSTQKSVVGEERVKQVEGMVEGKEQLRARKQVIKQEARDKMKQFEMLRLNAEKEAQQQMQEENEGEQEDEQQLQQGQIEEMLSSNKLLHDERFAMVTQQNQEVSILQRKLQNYPSAMEVAQYHQRFIELYDKINQETQQVRQKYDLFNNLTDIKQIVQNQLQVMMSFKENCSSAKQKKEKLSFLKNLQESMVGLQDNRQKSADLLSKTNVLSAQMQTKYVEMTQKERAYYKAIKELQTEYAKNEILMAQYEDLQPH